MTTTREQAELEYERIATESLNGEFLSVLITDALESKIKRIEELEQYIKVFGKAMNDYHNVYLREKKKVDALEKDLAEACIILKALDISVKWELAPEIKENIKEFLKKMEGRNDPRG